MRRKAHTYVPTIHRCNRPVSTHSLSEMSSIHKFFDKTTADDIYDNVKSLKLENANTSFTNKKSLHEYNHIHH